MKPGMGRTWLEQQGSDVQEVLNFVLGALVVVTIVAYAIFTGKAGIGFMSHSTSMGDPREKAHVQNALLNILYHQGNDAIMDNETITSVFLWTPFGRAPDYNFNDYFLEEFT